MIVKDIKPNGGQYRTEPVSLSGMDFVPPQASSVPIFMQLLGEEIRHGGVDRSPLEFAVSLHTKLVAIHPFIDGNGRTARLLLNAWLLAQGLPVVILNYADRERYLHCLSESNHGDLSSMVELFIECFEQQLEDITAVSEELTTPPGASEEIPLLMQKSLPKPDTDAIDEAIHEVSSAIVDDPIAIVMKEKILEQEKLIRLEYEAWKQSFLTILAELNVIVESFNSNDIYTREGYWMRLQEYDLLSFEKYGDLSRGKGATRTWFVGLEIAGPRSREKTLLFFSRASGKLIQSPNVSKVSLVVSRFDGARYQRLDTEPISLREIAYQDGVLLSLSRDGIMPIKSVQEMLKFLLAEIIKTYL